METLINFTKRDFFDAAKLSVTKTQTKDANGRPIPGAMTGVGHFLEVVQNEIIKEIEVVYMFRFRYLFNLQRNEEPFPRFFKRWE